MTLTDFIKANRQEIDKCISRVVGDNFPHNDSERRLWILNDEGLYLWAKNEGAKV